MTASKDTGAGIKRKEPSGRFSHELQAAEAELEELYIEFLAAQRVAKVFKRTSSNSRSASTMPRCGAWMPRRRRSRVAALSCSSSASTRPRSSCYEPS